MTLSSIKNIFTFKNVGLLEITIALYPILAGYGYGIFKLSFGLLLIIDMVLLLRNGRRQFNCKPLLLFSFYLMIHNVIWLTVVNDVNSHFLNSIIADLIYLCSVFIIAPYLDQKKLQNSIMIVALICIGGLLYHLILLQSGQSISPIKLPFMPEMDQESRLYAVRDRPSSFFWEPQSYSSFMTVPMFYALKERKMIWAFFIAITMVLSTSTTGIVMAVLMLVVYSISQRRNIYYSIVSIIIGVVVVYFLLNSQFAVAGLDKLNNTELEESNRVINGFLVVKDLKFSNLIFGIPYFSLQEAYDAHYLSNAVIVMADGEMFASAFWVCLICHGIVGLFLFLRIYFYIFRQNKAILPYLMCIVVGLFSNPDYVGASWVFQLCIMFAFLNPAKKGVQQLTSLKVIK